jgi:uracil-DNA glycosylase
LTGQRFVSPVPPGTGWPDDPATPATPVAAGPDDVRRLALGAAESPQLQPNDMFSAEKHVTTPQLRDSDQPPTLTELDARVSVCRACPRLVQWREDVAVEKRAAYAGEPYWGRPIAGWGDPVAAVLIVGLAPAAHGGNRTGRIFTGDRSGDWLFAALHRAGLAAQEDSRHAGDGQRLVRARMVAAVRCAPPQNKPTPDEVTTCLDHLESELAHLPNVHTVIALGKIAWDAWLQLLARYTTVPRPRPAFSHGVVVDWTAVPQARGPLAFGVAHRLVGCYHPSRQNTNTGVLTPRMYDEVFARVSIGD